MLEREKDQIEVFRCTVLDGSLAVALQPVFRLSDRSLDHYEALARFETVTGDESPAKYLNFAENAGLIAEFDYAMANQVINIVRASGDGSALPTVAINLSAKSLSNPRFLNSLVGMLNRDRMVASSLGFEVTGSGDLDNLASINNALQALKRTGACVGLDDFGIGGSDVNIFKRLDVDYLKFDGGYVASISETPRAAAYLKSITQLCDELEIITVAKKVENETDMAFLADNGFGYGQGYLFGKPRLASTVLSSPQQAAPDEPKSPLDRSEKGITKSDDEGIDGDDNRAEDAHLEAEVD